MPHTCIDWTTSPPVRKLPLLILKHGNERVYTGVPEQLKSLEQVVRTEFRLGDADIAFFSSCANLCDGLPARITEATWEQLSPYISCITVEVCGAELGPSKDDSHEEQPQAHKKTRDESKLNMKRKMAADTDDQSEHEQSDHDAGKKDLWISETVRDQLQAPSDHGNGHDSASAPGRHSEEEVSVILPQRSRKRRHVVTEDEDEELESEQDHGSSARSQPEAPPVVSPPKPAQPNGVKIDSGSRSQLESQSAASLHQQNKPIKQEKLESGSGSHPNSESHGTDSQPQSQHDQWTQSQIESNANQKLMIRVAHRPSKQESKFTTKSTTKVAKVLAGACKSFGLDPNRATMYLIVSTEDESGEEENLFPCDKNDSIARAGAERDTESRFLLKMAGEA